jgi:ferrous iron transport protein B
MRAGGAPAPAAPLAGAQATRPLVLVAGNPNSGKSTLFNALTGAHVKVSNYPGVTVSRTTALVQIPGFGPADLVDLPGTYSLSARSRDEQVAVDAVLGRGGQRPDAVLIVVDATALSRNLYFVNEVLETGAHVIVALNMVDEARASGIEIDVQRLAVRLGAPVVPIVARTGENLPGLLAALGTALGAPRRLAPAVPLPEAARHDVDELSSIVEREMHADHATARAWAMWVLLSVDEHAPDDLAGITPAVRAAARRITQDAAEKGRNIDLEIIGARYQRVDAIVAETVQHRRTSTTSWTDRVDGVLTHRVFGVVVFLAVMLALFQALFSWSEPLIALVQDSVATLQNVVARTMPPGPFTDLLTDGVIAGVGNVLAFVPQIGLLFLFIGLMEDVGYLARVAFVIDRVMGRVGLHGKSFVPMLSGFSCAVPAVMATRTLESRTDRMLTMAVLPLMSCSARLPVYVLVIATVFSPGLRVFGFASAAAVTLLAMYLLSVAAALTAAAVLRRTVLKGPRPTLMLELPPYRRPVMRVLLETTWRQVRSFLVDAGTTILALTIIVWAVLSYPRLDVRTGTVPRVSERGQSPIALSVATVSRAPEVGTVPLDTQGGLSPLSPITRGERLRNSFGGRLGRFMEPALQPLGFDWRIGVGILGAFTAREVFVSTMGIVFDIDNADEQSQPLRDALRSAKRADGSVLMTPLTGISLMVFFVLACQCASTLAVVRRESGSWSWPAFMFAYQTAMAYVAALVVYQGGRWLGFGG